MNSKNVNSTNAFKNKNVSNSSSFTNSLKKIDRKTVIKTVVIILFLCVLIYILICFANYYGKTCYKKKSFLEYLFDFKNSDVCEEEFPPQKITPPPSEPVKIIPISENEVFHIANQDYTYDQAKCKCESYGAKLATKDNMVDAYNKGATWCTYGWVEGQMAYYPVQQCDYDSNEREINKYPEGSEMRHKLYCGKPGLNGGFFPNSNLKFGVNCYGTKPKGKNGGIKMKDAYCPPMNFCKLEDNFNAAHKLDTDEISPFNHEKWSSSR